MMTSSNIFTKHIVSQCPVSVLPLTTALSGENVAVFSFFSSAVVVSAGGGGGEGEGDRQQPAVK